MSWRFLLAFTLFDTVAFTRLSTVLRRDRKSLALLGAASLRRRNLYFLDDAGRVPKLGLLHADAIEHRQHQVGNRRAFRCNDMLAALDEPATLAHDNRRQGVMVMRVGVTHVAA